MVQRALGLTNFGDEIPSPATFYNFKLALLIYELDSGILNDKIEVAITDGGYNSAANEELSRLPETSFKFYTTAIQGTKGNYDYELQEDGNYKVINRTRGKEQVAFLQENGTYRIKAVDIILNITNKLLKNSQILFGLFVSPDLRRGF